MKNKNIIEAYLQNKQIEFRNTKLKTEWFLWTEDNPISPMQNNKHIEWRIHKSPRKQELEEFLQNRIYEDLKDYTIEQIKENCEKDFNAGWFFCLNFLRRSKIITKEIVRTHA